MSQPIAIVGASARAAAASAIRAGFQPVTADLFADADLRRVATATRIRPYPEGLLDWLRTIEPPAWMYTGALENHPELVDQMAWIAPLWGNPGDVLQSVRSPLELANVLGDADLLFPETRTSADGLSRDGSWLAKTYQGASGSGVKELSKQYRVRSTEYDSSVPAPRRVPSGWLPAFYQRRIPGTASAAVFIAAEGSATLLGLTRQLIGENWLGAHGFQFAGSVGPLPISDAAFATVKLIGNTLAERFELVGLFGVDFILNGDEVWTIEVNPRYTASVEIVERVHNVQAIAAHAQACRELQIADCGLRIEEPPQSAIRNPKSAIKSHGKAILFARHDITLSQDFADWSFTQALHEPWSTVADVSPAGTQIEAGRPILTVFAEGITPNDVEQRLHQRVAEIEQKVYADPDNSARHR